MTKTDVLAHFGGVTEAAEKLGRTKGAVSQWPEELSFELQCYIEVASGYALKAERPTGQEAGCIAHPQCQAV